MATLTIKISDADLAMMERIAAHLNRRLQDLNQIIFGIGLSVHFDGEGVYIRKNEDELTDEQKEQLKVNTQLRQEGYYHLSEEEKAKTAYKDVEDAWQNFGPANGETYGFDNLIEPMANRIQRFATD